MVCKTAKIKSDLIQMLKQVDGQHRISWHGKAVSASDALKFLCGGNLKRNEETVVSR